MNPREIKYQPFPFLLSVCISASSVAVGTDLDKGSVISQDFMLPKWVFIRDRLGRYLTTRAGPQHATLTFQAQTGLPGLDCVFEPIRTSQVGYRFFGRNGRPIIRLATLGSTGWYTTDGTGSPSFTVILANGNFVYMQDDYVPSRFFSNELRDTGSPIARDDINESSRMEVIQAVDRTRVPVTNEIFNVQYNLSRAVVHARPPLAVFRRSVRNESDTTRNEPIEYSYHNWASGTWNNVAGVELGVQLRFGAQRPFISNANFDIRLAGHAVYDFGGFEGTRELRRDSTTVPIPPRRQGTVTVLVRNARLEVPFTYGQQIHWVNGHVDDLSQNAIYVNIDKFEVEIVLDLQAI